MFCKSNHKNHSKQIYFYIPGAESLSLLYFLAERYSSHLIVITPSISVKEICNLMELKYVHPIFYDSLHKVIKPSKSKTKNISKSNFSFIVEISKKIFVLISLAKKMLLAKKMAESLSKGATLYYSTFFYDIPGLLFLGSVVSSKNIAVKLVWTNNLMNFGKVEPAPFFSIATFLNIFNQNLFVFHLDRTFGRIVGINPEYLTIKNINFFHKEKKMECVLNDKYKRKAHSLLNINTFNCKPRVIFLGNYSVENGIELYGDTYLKVLNLLGNNNTVDVYYKPHPLYHSISHSALSNLIILDTQLPIEFLDDGSWKYIISFATAAITTPKLSTSICLLKIDELISKAINIPEFIKLLKNSDNKIVYPESLNELEVILESCK